MPAYPRVLLAGDAAFPKIESLIHRVIDAFALSANESMIQSSMEQFWKWVISSWSLP
jgi:hypothetical protein